MFGLLDLIPVMAMLVLLQPAADAFPAAALEFEARVLSLSEAAISGSYRLASDAGAGATVDHLAILFPSQEIEILSADAGGAPLRFELSPESSALRVALQLPASGAGHYRIRYRLTSGRLTRLPLLVPVVPGMDVSADRSTMLRVYLPQSIELVGDSFPWLESRAGMWEAVLPDPPGFLVLPLKYRRDTGLFEQLFTVGRATNIGLLLFLLGASACGIMIRRRRRSRSAAGP